MAVSHCSGLGHLGKERREKIDNSHYGERIQPADFSDRIRSDKASQAYQVAAPALAGLEPWERVSTSKPLAEQGLTALAHVEHVPAATD
jgi:hypothetical protein